MCLTIVLAAAVVAMLQGPKKSRSAGVAEAGLRAIAALALESDDNRWRLGQAGCRGE